MSKEMLKPNKVEAPTLFVGVGGTGSKIINRVANLCKPEEMENINFVVLDTNVNDLLAINKASGHMFAIQTSNTQTVGNYLDYDQDACKNWFPKNAVIYDKTVSEGAGQVRAISRLALNACIKTGNIMPLYDAIDALFKKTGNDMKQAMRVVIASTASGGTGSGMILPLSMLIREYVNSQYPNTSLIVRSIILLPETLNNVIKSSVERDSQARNAYATIKEINAFMMKGSGFLDVDDEMKRYKDIHVDITSTGTGKLKSLSLLPFDFCFLLDGQDSNDSTMIGIEQYMDQAAQALYEQNIGPMQAGAFSVEDNIIKEMADPGNLGRNRFGGIGASVMRYPYEKIADYIAYDWAFNAIGDPDSKDKKASKWTRYDAEFKNREATDKKNNRSETERTKLEAFYCETIEKEGQSNSMNPFSRDLWNKYLSGADGRIKTYYAKINSDTVSYLLKNQKISNYAKGFEDLKDVKYSANNSKNIKPNLDTLKALDFALEKNAKDIAASFAYSLFYGNDNTFGNNITEDMIESVFKNSDGEAYHPNAARYGLYKLYLLFSSKTATLEKQIQQCSENLKVFTGEGSSSDFKSVALKREASSFDKFIDLANGKKKVSKKKMAAYYVEIQKKMQEFASNIEEYYKAVCEYAICLAGAEFTRALAQGYKTFFDGFEKKAKTIKRKQDDLVDELKFRKGDSIFNVCAEEKILKALSESETNAAQTSEMLDSEVNGMIFAAVKANAIADRNAMASSDVVAQKSDVFDDILLGYFKKSVRETCANLDMNILDALKKEYELSEKIRIKEQNASRRKDEEEVVFKESDDAKARYILEKVGKAKVLAAPGVQPPKNVQQRLIELCAYNVELLNDRSFRIKEKVPGSAVETVSRYEIHFFNALYNLTPDKIVKFYCPKQTETRNRKAGTYHRAYVEYQSNIGPDSTKNKMISTHIDKRWDSISVMPEIDFDFQHEKMMRIHKALVRSLVYNFIAIDDYTVIQRGKKYVYKYENINERKENLVVSNGTLCDCFYEILDALYNSPSTVQNIELRREKLLLEDKSDHHDYEHSAFGKAAEAFRIPITKSSESGKCEVRKFDETSSLFEIPLTYYQSLPNNLRYLTEISNMIDAVIECIKEELTLWENEDDVKFKLCDKLQEQYDLLLKHYTKENDYMTGEFPLAKENPVIDIILRKITDAMKESPAPDDYETIENSMRSRLE